MCNQQGSLRDGVLLPLRNWIHDKWKQITSKLRYCLMENAWFVTQPPLSRLTRSSKRRKASEKMLSVGGNHFDLHVWACDWLASYTNAGFMLCFKLLFQYGRFLLRAITRSGIKCIHMTTGFVKDVVKLLLKSQTREQTIPLLPPPAPLHSAQAFTYILVAFAVSANAGISRRVRHSDVFQQLLLSRSLGVRRVVDVLTDSPSSSRLWLWASLTA